MADRLDQLRNAFKENEKKSGHNSGGQTAIGSAITIDCGCGGSFTKKYEHMMATPAHATFRAKLERIQKRREAKAARKAHRATRRRGN
jgi:hypothetical protein